MDYVELGRSGLKVSAIGLGTWQFGSGAWGWGKGYGRDDAIACVKKAIDLGINFIDTAELYGGGTSERIVGEAIEGRRSEVVIATKVSPWNLWHNRVLKAAERSLERLGIKEIDLYQIHFPNRLASINGTMTALHKLVKDGEVRYIGVSNFGLAQLKSAMEALPDQPIASNQVEYSLITRNAEKELLPFAKEEGLTIIAYSPLAQGALTGKYDAESYPDHDVRAVNILFTPQNLRRLIPLLEVLQGIGRERGKTISQVALNWLIREDRVLAIPGAKNPVQVEGNAGATGWRLSHEELKAIDESCEKISLEYFMSVPRVVLRSLLHFRRLL